VTVFSLNDISGLRRSKNVNFGTLARQRHGSYPLFTDKRVGVRSLTTRAIPQRFCDEVVS